MKNDSASHGDSSSAGMRHYARLAAMTAMSFVAMFVLMYAMVDRASNVFGNLNQAYMAGLMTAPMVIIELALMWRMYRNRRLNLAILSVCALALATFWLSIRAQAGISDQQFLKSMIPHHASAILMCKQTTLRDPEIEELCHAIVSSQQQEIDFMKRKLGQGEPASARSLPAESPTPK